jgi:anti-sigma factor RsiW
MTCREASNLLPLFFDGELDSRQMRAVALHGTRCSTCEVELRNLNRLQELISETVSAAADEVDFSDLWSAIEKQISAVRVPWRQRVRLWWEDRDQWALRLPAFAAAALVAALALLLFGQRLQSPTQPEGAQIAAVDNGASIDSLDTDVDSVAVLSDPETRTTVLWVNDDASSGGDTP